VHPQDPWSLYFGFAYLYYSADDGGSFKRAGEGVVHADNHHATFSPPNHNNRAAYVSSDSGIFASADGLRWSDRNKALAVSLITQIGIGLAVDTYMYAGLWDMGGLSRRIADDTGLWYLGQGPWDYGDGGAVAVAPSNSAISHQVGNFTLTRTTDGGRHWEAPPLPTDNYFALAYTATRDGGRVYRKGFYASKGPTSTTRARR
jgi:hypothetical protein